MEQRNVESDAAAKDNEVKMVVARVFTKVGFWKRWVLPQQRRKEIRLSQRKVSGIVSEGVWHIVWKQ